MNEIHGLGVFSILRQFLFVGFLVSMMMLFADNHTKIEIDLVVPNFSELLTNFFSPTTPSYTIKPSLDFRTTVSFDERKSTGVIKTISLKLAARIFSATFHEIFMHGRFTVGI